MAARLWRYRPPSRRRLAGGLRLRAWVTAVLCGCVLLVAGGKSVGAPAADEPAADKLPKVDVYILLGRTMVWMGDRFHFTLYEPARVEARINSMLGEALDIMRLGPMQPGQHTLPWNGVYQGQSVYAGKYEFELYFDDEYAARFWFFCRPREIP